MLQLILNSGHQNMALQTIDQNVELQKPEKLPK